MPVLKQLQVNKSVYPQVYERTLDLKDLTVGNDIADAVTAFQAGAVFCVVGIVHRTLASDLSVRVKINGTALATFVLSHSLALLTPQLYTVFSGSPALALNSIFTWDITASDGTVDPTGVASVTVMWS